MSQITDSVGTSQTGSRRADFGSGIRIMSDSWIFWNPRMLEPSKPMPSSQMEVWMSSSSVSSRGGMEKCCQRPGRSLNFRSTIWIPFSLMNVATSSGVTAVLLCRDPWLLDGHLAALARAHADGILHRDDEDLAVADVAGAGGLRDDVDGLVAVRVLHHDF